jgi:hypothetical protein
MVQQGQCWIRPSDRVKLRIIEVEWLVEKFLQCSSRGDEDLTFLSTLATSLVQSMERNSIPEMRRRQTEQGLNQGQWLESDPRMSQVVAVYALHSHSDLELLLIQQLPSRGILTSSKPS